MREIEARVRCLEIAERLCARHHNRDTAAIVAEAEKLKDFALGKPAKGAKPGQSAKAADPVDGGKDRRRGRRTA